MDKQASLLGVQNNKLSTVQDRDMSAENLEHSCSVVVKDLVTSSTHDTRGDNSCTTSERYVKILDFRHFERHFMFSQGDRKYKKKAISDGVNVSVVLDMVLGNT